MTVTAYIALGSNLGDRRGYLERALDALRRHGGLTVRRVSPVYETAPVGGATEQPPYLNAAAEAETCLGAHELLQALLATERDLGRTRREPNGPRTIDLDLLAYGNLVLNEPDLVLPHPRLHERWFVLKPLADLAPDYPHPVLGRTVAELLRQLPAPVEPASRELAGLRAMVTGSTKGIGRAIAWELAAAGARVLMHGRLPDPTAFGQLRDRDPGARMLAADLNVAAECERLAEEAWQAVDGLDIWVNNAGADTLTGEAARWGFEQKLEALLAVDVRATVLLSRAVGRRMRERCTGAIVNVGWDQAETGMEGDSGQLFAAAKAAVMAFSRSLALTLGPQVRVNCLAPGWIRTAWAEQASEPWHERVRRETPMRRWGTPEDVAAAARWLVSPAAAYVTGQTIRVNGGAVR
jgi:2-amino-4-hydroxy-6-hydroxymethyldihydropteridine diphosphokinase